MEKITYYFKEIETEVYNSRKPKLKLLLFGVTFVFGLAAMYFYKDYEAKNINEQIKRNDENNKKEINELLYSKNRMEDSLKNMHYSEIISINTNHEHQIFDLKNELRNVLNENFREKANYILETANLNRLLPDSITSFFNTLPKDRPLLQISNKSLFPNSSLHYNYELNAKRNDIITLYFWIHNTSFNDAINPCINLMTKKASDRLISFSATLSATNMNSSEYGSAFLTYEPEAESYLIIKDLFCFKVLEIKVYENREAVNQNSSIAIYSYPESFCFNSGYNIYTSTIPALKIGESQHDLFYNQYTIIMNIAPVYLN